MELEGPSAVRVIWNPSRAQLPLGPPDLWRRHRASEPSIELLGSDDVMRGARVRIPAAPPGQYVIATFDGSEGGTHYTWDYFRVQGAARGREDNRDAYHLLFWLVVGTGAGLFVAALVRLPRRRN